MQDSSPFKRIVMGYKNLLLFFSSSSHLIDSFPTRYVASLVGYPKSDGWSPALLSLFQKESRRWNKVSITMLSWKLGTNRWIITAATLDIISPTGVKRRQSRSSAKLRLHPSNAGTSFIKFSFHDQFFYLKWSHQRIKRFQEAIQWDAENGVAPMLISNLIRTHI